VAPQASLVFVIVDSSCRPSAPRARAGGVTTWAPLLSAIIAEVQRKMLWNYKFEA